MKVFRKRITMRIGHEYSHLNGKEWLLYHHPNLWDEIVESISSTDASKCMTKISKEKTMKGQLKYSPSDMNEKIKAELGRRDWSEKRKDYWVTGSTEVTREIVLEQPEEQKRIIEESGATPIHSYHQTDYVKNRVAVEVQFGKYAFIEFDLFAKHLGFYLGNDIDLGVEIVPTKSLQARMSSGPGYFERTLTHVLRQGRASPSVPFIMLGIEP
jgi:hypothetical protein